MTDQENIKLSEGMKSMFKSHALNDNPVDDSWEHILFDVPKADDSKYLGGEYKEPLVLIEFAHRES